MEALLLLKEAVQAVGLQLNYGKTNYMGFLEQNAVINGMNGEVLDEVDNFKYLGSWQG